MRSRSLVAAAAILAVILLSAPAHVNGNFISRFSRTDDDSSSTSTTRDVSASPAQHGVVLQVSPLPQTFYAAPPGTTALNHHPVVQPTPTVFEVRGSEVHEHEHEHGHGVMSSLKRAIHDMFATPAPTPPPTAMQQAWTKAKHWLGMEEEEEVEEKSWLHSWYAADVFGGIPRSAKHAKKTSNSLWKRVKADVDEGYSEFTRALQSINPAERKRRREAEEAARSNKFATIVSYLFDPTSASSSDVTDASRSSHRHHHELRGGHEQNATSWWSNLGSSLSVPSSRHRQQPAASVTSAKLKAAAKAKLSQAAHQMQAATSKVDLHLSHYLPKTTPAWITSPLHVVEGATHMQWWMFKEVATNGMGVAMWVFDVLSFLAVVECLSHMFGGEVATPMIAKGARVMSKGFGAIFGEPGAPLRWLRIVLALTLFAPLSAAFIIFALLPATLFAIAIKHIVTATLGAAIITALHLMTHMPFTWFISPYGVRAMLVALRVSGALIMLAGTADAAQLVAQWSAAGFREGKKASSRRNSGHGFFNEYAEDQVAAEPEESAAGVPLTSSGLGWHGQGKFAQPPLQMSVDDGSGLVWKQEGVAHHQLRHGVESLRQRVGSIGGSSGNRNRARSKARD